MVFTAALLTWTSPATLTGFAASTISSRWEKPHHGGFCGCFLLTSTIAGFEVPGLLPDWSPFQDQANLNLNRPLMNTKRSCPDCCTPHFCNQLEIHLKCLVFRARKWQTKIEFSSNQSISDNVNLYSVLWKIISLNKTVLGWIESRRWETVDNSFAERPPVQFSLGRNHFNVLLCCHFKNNTFSSGS